MERHDIQKLSATERRVWGGLVAGLGLSIAVIVSSLGDDSALGAPPMWPWILTGLQVLSLWAAGRRHWWGWLLGGSVQLPWIAYAVVTAQIGFIPGCLISVSIQLFSFVSNSAPPQPMKVFT